VGHGDAGSVKVTTSYLLCECGSPVFVLQNKCITCVNKLCEHYGREYERPIWTLQPYLARKSKKTA
jgi:hypothetical protein